MEDGRMFYCHGFRNPYTPKWQSHEWASFLKCMLLSSYSHSTIYKTLSMLLLVYRKNWHFLCYRSFVLVVLHFLLYTLYFFSY